MEYPRILATKSDYEFVRQNFPRNLWEKDFNNPVEIAELVGAYIDNNDNYNISMWICLDEGVLIKITNKNADDIIKYLYERFPY